MNVLIYLLLVEVIKTVIPFNVFNLFQHIFLRITTYKIKEKINCFVPLSFLFIEFSIEL